MFDVKAKLMGVHLETVQLEYQVLFLSLLLVRWRWVWVESDCVSVFCPSVSQDLLQLQYEGVAVMKLFDRATINVNLLIFLLNKKFYGK